MQLQRSGGPFSSAYGIKLGYVKKQAAAGAGGDGVQQAAASVGGDGVQQAAAGAYSKQVRVFIQWKHENHVEQEDVKQEDVLGLDRRVHAHLVHILSLPGQHLPAVVMAELDQFFRFVVGLPTSATRKQVKDASAVGLSALLPAKGRRKTQDEQPHSSASAPWARSAKRAASPPCPKLDCPSKPTTGDTPAAPASADQGNGQPMQGSPSRRPSKKERSSSACGRHPNVGMHALSSDELYAHPSYLRLSQPVTEGPIAPTDLHALAPFARQDSPARQGVATAFVIPQLLGIFHPCGIAKLGKSASSRADAEGCHAAYAALGVLPAAHPAAAAEVPHTAQLAMEWGTLHEPNAFMALEPEAPPAAGSLAECGLFTITQHAAPYHHRLPPIGASPDGILWLNGQMRAVVEAKCRFPLVDSEEHGYKYIGCKQHGKAVCARQAMKCHWFRV
jgi:hypothetical protein